MATCSVPKLTITGSPTPGKSVVKVEFDIHFDLFDVAAEQRYEEQVRIFGDDVPPDPDDHIEPLGQGWALVFPSQGTPGFGGSNLKRTLTETIDNVRLDEDGGAATDEIRAVVTLTPVWAKLFTQESNVVTLALP